MEPKIGLALGGGGVRGFAHLGVIKILKKHQVSISAVAGTSAGAIAGAFLACGADLEMAEKVLLSVDLKKFMNVRFQRTGFVDGKNLTDLVRLFTKNKNIEDTEIPLKIVAVDLINRETVIFDRGNIAEAVRASVSIPGIFTPVKKDGRMLVDGCILNNCPADVVKGMGMDIVLAVDLESKTFSSGEPANIFEVVMRSWEIMSRTKMPAGADVVISPIYEPVGQLDFSRSTECLRMGEKAVEAKMSDIKKALAAFH